MDGNVIRAFYSDPHFGHDKIIELCNRPFDNVAEMNDILVDRYNFMIKPTDTVIWLGDCFFMPINESRNIMNRLNGEKILVRGGHDGSDSRMLRAGFSAVTDQMTMQICDKICTLNHFPYAGTPHKSGEDDRYASRRPKAKKGQYLIHGHTHSQKQRQNNQIHVGVDAWDFAPVEVEDVWTLIKINPQKGTKQ